MIPINSPKSCLAHLIVFSFWSAKKSCINDKKYPASVFSLNALSLRFIIRKTECLFYIPFCNPFVYSLKGNLKEEEIHFPPKICNIFFTFLDLGLPTRIVCIVMFKKRCYVIFRYVNSKVHRYW